MRKLSGMMLMILMALLLAACGGNDDSDEEPTEEATEPAVSTVVPTETEANTEEATVAASAVASPAVAGATPVGAASPVAAGATPVGAASPVVTASPEAGALLIDSASPVTSVSPVSASASPAVGASPVMVAPVSEASPVTMASPIASTPAASDFVVPASSDKNEATPAASPAATITLDGRVEISGKENQAYVLSDNGCVGLGDNADLQEGRQVVIRDESGAIIGLTELQAAGDTDGCAWTFEAEVAESEFYAVSIPMKTELVFTHDDIAKSEGEITIILP